MLESLADTIGVIGREACVPGIILMVLAACLCNIIESIKGKSEDV